MLLRILLYTRE